MKKKTEEKEYCVVETIWDDLNEHVQHYHLNKGWQLFTVCQHPTSDSKVKLVFWRDKEQ